MKKEETQELREIADSFKELVRWIKFANIDKAKSVLEKTLNEPRKIQAYHLSNGKNTLQIIGERVGVNKDVLNGWWKIWNGLGITEPVSARGGSRAKKIFELANFGIAVPTIRNKTVPSGETEVNGEELDDK